MFEPLQRGEVKNHYDGASIEDSMASAAHYWGQKGVTFVYKGTGFEDTPNVRQVMHEIGTYPVVVWRGNSIDKVVCMVRDCFSKNMGYPVNSAGQESKLCFNRRTKAGSS